MARPKSCPNEIEPTLNRPPDEQQGLLMGQNQINQFRDMDHQIALIQQSLGMVEQRLGLLATAINQVSTVLVGNGNPDKSVVVQLTKLAESVRNCQHRADEYRNQMTGNFRTWIPWITSVASTIALIIVALTR
jgi:hypothetical protein